MCRMFCFSLFELPYSWLTVRRIAPPCAPRISSMASRIYWHSQYFRAAREDPYLFLWLRHASMAQDMAVCPRISAFRRAIPPLCRALETGGPGEGSGSITGVAEKRERTTRCATMKSSRNAIESVSLTVIFPCHDRVEVITTESVLKPNIYDLSATMNTQTTISLTTRTPALELDISLCYSFIAHHCSLLPTLSLSYLVLSTHRYGGLIWKSEQPEYCHKPSCVAHALYLRVCALDFALRDSQSHVHTQPLTTSRCR